MIGLWSRVRIAPLGCLNFRALAAYKLSLTRDLACRGNTRPVNIRTRCFMKTAVLYLASLLVGSVVATSASAADKRFRCRHGESPSRSSVIFKRSCPSGVAYSDPDIEETYFRCVEVAPEATSYIRYNGYYKICVQQLSHHIRVITKAEAIRTEPW